MLRASAQQSERPGVTAAIVADAIDPGMVGGVELRNFTSALIRSVERDDGALVAARTALLAAVGEAGAARAATVAGNFEMMNRLLDAAGVPVPNAMLDVGRAHDVID